MKLSDAIEAGWKDLDQVFVYYAWPTQSPYEEAGVLHGYDPAKTMAVCALGAACVAVERGSEPGPEICYQHWPELEQIPTKETHPLLPIGDAPFQDCTRVSHYVSTLNDFLTLPKEKIVAQVRAWGL